MRARPDPALEHHLAQQLLSQGRERLLVQRRLPPPRQRALARPCLAGVPQVQGRRLGPPAAPLLDAVVHQARVDVGGEDAQPADGLLARRDGGPERLGRQHGPDVGALADVAGVDAADGPIDEGAGVVAQPRP